MNLEYKSKLILYGTLYDSQPSTLFSKSTSISQEIEIERRRYLNRNSK